MRCWPLQIISLTSLPLQLLQNVPDLLAFQIPPSLLAFPEGIVDIKILNVMVWTRDQVRGYSNLFLFESKHPVLPTKCFSFLPF